MNGGNNTYIVRPPNIINRIKKPVDRDSIEARPTTVNNEEIVAPKEAVRALSQPALEFSNVIIKNDLHFVRN